MRALDSSARWQLRKLQRLPAPAALAARDVMLPALQAQTDATTRVTFRRPACRAFSGPQPAAACSGGIEMLATSAAGRGYFATRRLRVGERILAEAPVVSDDLVRLAEVILNTPRLRHGLHMPARFHARENPPPGCSQEDWSRACAQAMSNGCVNVWA